MNFTDPVKKGFGRYLYGFHQQLVPDTQGVSEFAGREFGKAAVWAPGRMADSVEDMLEAWRKNDTSLAAQPKVYMPVMIAAMSKDFTPAPGDYHANRGDWQDVMIPSDPKRRVFRMRAVTRDIRTVVLIAAADEPTAISLALQLQGYCSEMHNRRFAAIYPLVGYDEKWPVALEMPDVMGVAVPTDQKNLTLMTVEFSLRATIPMLKAPRSNEPNDGQGEGPNQDNPFAPGYDPSGYPVVVEARGTNYPPRIPSDPMGTWVVRGLPDDGALPPGALAFNGGAILFDGQYVTGTWPSGGNPGTGQLPPGAATFNDNAVLFDGQYLVIS